MNFLGGEETLDCLGRCFGLRKLSLGRNRREDFDVTDETEGRGPVESLWCSAIYFGVERIALCIGRINTNDGSRAVCLVAPFSIRPAIDVARWDDPVIQALHNADLFELDDAGPTRLGNGRTYQLIARTPLVSATIEFHYQHREKIGSLALSLEKAAISILEMQGDVDFVKKVKHACVHE